MTYLIFSLDDELIDIIDFGSKEDRESFLAANPGVTLELTDTIDDIYGIDDDLEDEW